MTSKLFVRRKMVLLTTALVVVGGVWGSMSVFPLPTVFAPPEYFGANLQVEVVLEEWGGALLPVAAIGCPMFDISAEGMEALPLWYFNWCGERALNEPVQLDANGKAVLWFRLHPRPHKAGIDFEAIGGAPSIGLKYPNGASGVYRPEIIAPDHWYLGVPQRR